MQTILRSTTYALWSVLLIVILPALNLKAAADTNFSSSDTSTNAAHSNAQFTVLNPPSAKANLVRTPLVSTVYTGTVVMVSLGDEKFAVVHDGKIDQFKMAQGGVLFRKGNATTLDWFAVGQEVLIVGEQDPRGRTYLMSASILPNRKSAEAAGKLAK